VGNVHGVYPAGMSVGSEHFPRIVNTSVVRSAHKGESHGGVFLLDLKARSVQQVLDWNDDSIDWEGRGGDRGLRGIAFHAGRVFLAASDEIFIYDKAFNREDSLRNRYLRHCHEIFVVGDRLFATSTGFDSVLECDLTTGSFVRGYCVRFSGLFRNRQIRPRLKFRPHPTLSTFDPNAEGGPSLADTSHINNVYVDAEGIYLSGMGLGNLWRIQDSRLSSFARIPYWTHNARPFRDGVVLNWSSKDRVASFSRQGRVLRSVDVPHYSRSKLENSDLPRDFAREGFARGLTTIDDRFVVGGSSPSTITLYDLDDAKAIESINISMDVRNCVHGLEIWPFG
jgi:hypothetical protein